MNDIHFDYLAVTLRVRVGASVPYFIAGWLSQRLQEDYEESTIGLRNYEKRLEFKTSGVKVLFGGETQRNTIHVIIPGLGCKIIGIAGLRAFGLHFHEHYHLTVTRLDIAIDVEGDKYLSEWLEIKKSVVSPYVKKYKVIQESLLSTDKILSRTVYIGSRTSPRMLRIYGKSDEDGRVYTRAEMEVKSDPAHDLYSAFLWEDASIYDLAVTAFDNYFDVETFFETSLAGLCIPVEFSKRAGMRNTIAWALSVSGAFVSLFEYYGRDNVISMLQEHDRAKAIAKKRARARTPVGNTGVTNFSFADLPASTFADFVKKRKKVQ